MINKIKWDFMGVKWQLEYLVKRDIPMGIAILYYVVVGVIMLPFYPIMWVSTKIYLRRLEKQCEKLERELGI
jgi:uncharacterized integral membrane protein